MYELPGEVRVHMGRSIDAAKHILGHGITEMWAEYFNGLPPRKRTEQLRGTAASLLKACDYLGSVRAFLPSESQRGLLSAHGLSEVRQCIEDFTGASPTQRHMAVFFGYRENPDYQGPDLYRRFLFSKPEAGGKHIDRRIDELARTKEMKRISMGSFDVLLNHGEQEITIARWTEPKLNRGYHYFVVGRVVTTEADPADIAVEMCRRFDVFPESFVPTMEHALF